MGSGIRALLVVAAAVRGAAASDVRVDVTEPAPGNPKVTTDHSYDAHVTLWIEGENGERTASGWSTRPEDNGNGRPFTFQPGKNLIRGWSLGVVKMREGERALIHVPPELGYGTSPQGREGGAWYIPGNSNLLFDIEILGKANAGKRDL
mmetsp:Transcript_1385/g.3725  ORF Transcript_1385/g.3725 Transcript_1385/m.3725 type:complete len:149 (-) Transcript_1385:138-584(-)|eukprot:CAMPEP_0182927168 /NCGR_PEP_ID=MMETSP0105_2-20130417/13389_1 /TAXON_ID=81532 ORGANISM="Acanthoeca-like sp., Strain 10tr" /NCGR_SAMPLE_ID=MMETSP0105_2 /ASSEMBLY_ACC=CAM_ASM_000205 /LENGTH=148 /DNA_ID=CAMNT_0025065099 /DNA_START=8 /DNA_END=454 /DNA_ORIENTATION=+